MRGKPGSANCTGETLTATRICCGHCMASSQALRRIHSPIRQIIIDSSAMGMNIAGEIEPRSGWFQRTSASVPTT